MPAHEGIEPPIEHGLVLGCAVAAAVALLGAVMVAVLLPAKPKTGEPTPLG